MRNADFSESFDQIYRDQDKPLYRKGNKVLIGICVYNIALFVGAKAFYMTKNRFVYPHIFISKSILAYLSNQVPTMRFGHVFFEAAVPQYLLT